MKQVPRVNKGECISCGVCVDTCPAVFRFDEENRAEVYDPRRRRRGGDPGGDRPLPGGLHLLGRGGVTLPSRPETGGGYFLPPHQLLRRSAITFSWPASDGS